MLGLPLAFFAFILAPYWFLFGGGRRYRGIVVIFCGALLLAITAIAAINSDSLPSAVVVAGIVASVLLGWLGYKLPRWLPREPSAEPIQAETTLAAIRFEQSEQNQQVPCGGDAAASKANKPTRPANSRSSSLFASSSRRGHGGSSAR